MRRVISERERQVIALVAEGMDNDRIGRALHISPDTVKTHLARLYRRYEAHGRAHLVAIAIREGWIA